MPAARAASLSLSPFSSCRRRAADVWSFGLKDLLLLRACLPTRLPVVAVAVRRPRPAPQDWFVAMLYVP